MILNWINKDSEKRKNANNNRNVSEIDSVAIKKITGTET